MFSTATRLLAGFATVALSGATSASATLDVTPSAMYGSVATLRSPQQTVTVAVRDGGRVVSWKIDGHEVGFVGRAWGGDFFADCTVNKKSVPLRIRRTTGAERLEGDRGIPGVRTEFRLAPPEVGTPVSIERTTAMSGGAVFVSVRIRNTAPKGAVHVWYTFAPHLRNQTDGDRIGMLHYLGAAGEDLDLPLSPRTFKPDELPVQQAQVAGKTVKWQAVAITGPVPGKALVFRVADPGRLGTRAYSGSVRLDFSVDAPGLGPGDSATLRMRWDVVPIERAPCLLRSPPSGFPVFPRPGQSVPADTVGDAAPRNLPRTPVAAEYGSWGVCQSRQEYFPALAAAGFRWVRMGGFGWGAVEPAPGRVDYADAEKRVTAALSEGMACIGEFSGNPGWATVDGDGLSRPRDWARWAAHVKRTVQRFRDRVHVWEIWNEPDIGSFWHGTPAEYVELLRHAFRAAKAADPTCRVMSAGLDGSGEAFLDKTLGLGLGDCCDLIGAHPYAGTAELAEYRMRMMRRILNFHGVHKPLWITEVGWQSGGWKSGPGVTSSEAVKAERLAASLPGLARHAEVVCWYRGVEPGRMYGLVRPVGGEGGVQLQPAWFAMRKIALPAHPEVALEVPEKTMIAAGKTTELSATVDNRGQAPVRVRWVGLDPGWGGPFSTLVPPGEKTVTKAEVRPPAYLPSQERDLLVVVQKPKTGRHLANAVVHAKIENSGRSLAVRLTGGWVQKVDAAGKPLDRWRPINQVVLHPGDAFVQPLRPRNGGTVDDEYALTLSGTGAKWVHKVPDTVRVAVGKVGWIGLRVHIPADAKPGTYTLEAQVRSRAQQAVQGRFSTTFSVRQPDPGHQPDSKKHL